MSDKFIEVNCSVWGPTQIATRHIVSFCKDSQASGSILILSNKAIMVTEDSCEDIIRKISSHPLLEKK